MFRKLLVGLISLIGLSAVAYAGQPFVAEGPQEICTAGYSVTITSFSWTVVPSAQCAGRTGLYVNALSGNTGTARCIATASSSTPSVSTATYSFWENTPSSNAMFLGLKDNQYLWCLTTHTGSETVSGVEVKQ